MGKDAIVASGPGRWAGGLARLVLPREFQLGNAFSRYATTVTLMAGVLLSFPGCMRALFTFSVLVFKCSASVAADNRVLEMSSGLKCQRRVGLDVVSVRRLSSHGLDMV